MSSLAEMVEKLPSIFSSRAASLLTLVLLPFSRVVNSKRKEFASKSPSMVGSFRNGFAM